MKKFLTLGMIISSILLSSCTHRLIDFTVISSKNVALRPKGKTARVNGSSIGFLGIGCSIKDAVDNAIQKSGVNGADLLLDGVVRSITYPFISGFKVEGTAVNSSELKAELGTLRFNDYCQEHGIKIEE